MLTPACTRKMVPTLSPRSHTQVVHFWYIWVVKVKTEHEYDGLQGDTKNMHVSYITCQSQPVSDI